MLIDFKGLTVIGAHMGHPYEALLMQYMLKWPDLYLSNSAYLAKYMDPALVSFMDSTRGMGRVLFASDHPFLPDGAGGGRRPGSASLRRGGRGLPRRHGRPPPRPRLSIGRPRPAARPADAPGTVRRMDLGRIGVWWSGSWRDPDDPERSVAPELEALGYGALWSSGRFDPGLSPHFEKLLAATDHVPVASGIVSIWAGAPEDVGPAVAALEDRFPGRFLLGIGASHGVAVADYTRPYSKMVAYLDALDALPTPVPPSGASWPPSGRACSSSPPPGPPAPIPTSSRSSTRHAPGTSSARDPCWRPRLPSSSRRTRSGRGNWPGATPAPTSACPTTRRTCAPSASATTTSTAAGATV